jgi:hypothetical protein
MKSTILPNAGSSSLAASGEEAWPRHFTPHKAVWHCCKRKLSRAVGVTVSTSGEGEKILTLGKICLVVEKLICLF